MTNTRGVQSFRENDLRSLGWRTSKTSCESNPISCVLCPQSHLSGSLSTKQELRFLEKWLPVQWGWWQGRVGVKLELMLSENIWEWIFLCAKRCISWKRLEVQLKLFVVLRIISIFSQERWSWVAASLSDTLKWNYRRNPTTDYLYAVFV